MHHARLSVFFLVLLFSLFFSRCGKKEDGVDNETNSVSDLAQISAGTMDVIAFALQSALHRQELGGITSPACDSLSLTGGDVSDFSPSAEFRQVYSNCYTADGQGRSGSARLAFTGKINAAGSEIGIVTTDYVLADRRDVSKRFSCNIQLTTSSTVQDFQTSRCDVALATADRSASCSFSIKGKYTAGELVVSGTGTGVNRDGRSFSFTITPNDPFHKFTHCSQIHLGVAEVAPAGLKSRLVNFGKGDCDDMATIVVNGNKVALELK